MERIKVGIVGLGRSGWNIHAKTFEKLSELYKVVAVADPIEDRRREAVEKFNCRAYSEFEQFLDDREVELVVIATPSHLHAKQTIEALKAGKHVVCEKPMAKTLSEADEMVKTARETGKTLTIFQNSLFMPDFLKVKEVIGSGKLGEVVLVKIYAHSFGRRWDWQTLKKYGGGELRNNGVHYIIQALDLMGNKDPIVFCDLRRTLTLGDAEDHVKILLKAPGAPLVDIEVTHACAYPQNKWLIMATRGSLTGTLRTLKWKYFKPGDLPPRKVLETPTPDRSYNVEEIPWIEESWTTTKDVFEESRITFYKKLYKTLKYGEPPPVPPEKARKVMEIIEKCYKQCNNL